MTTHTFFQRLRKPLNIEWKIFSSSSIIIQQRNLGMKLKEISEVFPVSVSEAPSIFRPCGQTGSIGSKKKEQSGPGPYFNEERLGRLRDELEKTWYPHKRRAYRTLGMNRKKITPIPAEASLGKNAEERVGWAKSMKGLHVPDIWFLGEAGFKTNIMRTLYWLAFGGERHTCGIPGPRHGKGTQFPALSISGHSGQSR
ncbi:MAG: hypothetical protein FWG10_12130 [Eubacteriaceae bacterium]|nr:hypothetical protein [Eubacteriaceae bacterium]